MTTAATEPGSQLRCPRCGAKLARDQDWCLECGAAASTRVLRPPSWKLAAAVVLGVLAAVALAVVIAVSSLSRDADRAVATPAARSSPSTAPAAAAAMPTTAARPTTTTSTATTTASSTSPPLATWPPGRRAWTVVLATAPSRAAAERRARELVARGVKAGVLDTSKFDVAASGAFVVFRGRFPSQAAAVAEETRLQREAPPSAFVAEVSPR